MQIGEEFIIHSFENTIKGGMFVRNMGEIGDVIIFKQELDSLKDYIIAYPLNDSSFAYIYHKSDIISLNIFKPNE